MVSTDSEKHIEDLLWVGTLDGTPVTTAEICEIAKRHGWEFGEDLYEIGTESSLGVWFAKKDWNGLNLRNPISVYRWGSPENRDALIRDAGYEAWTLYRKFIGPPGRCYDRETKSFFWRES